MSASHRLLTLDPAGLLWGSERALLDFIGDIPGFEAACCCPPETPLIEKLNACNVACFPTFQPNLHLRGMGARLWALYGLLRAILACRPDVLHINQAGATRIALLACRVFRIPCVVHVRLQEDVEYLNALRPSPKFLKRLIAISQPIADLLKEQPNLEKIPCTMLMDAYRLTGAGTAIERAPTRWDFVCVGRFSASKGQDVLIRAMDQLRQTGISASLVFVGEINDCAVKVQQLVRDLKLESAVDFVGHQDEVGNYLTQARWLICPSGYEPLGRVLFEAWDHGIPVVAGTCSGGAATSVAASGGGLLFAEWTADSLADCLAKAMSTDARVADQMANKGRTWLGRAANPTRYAAAMANLLQDAIQSNGKSP